MLDQGHKPTAILKREVKDKEDTPFGPSVQPGADGHWYVPAEPIVNKDGDTTVKWAVTKQGEYVNVPLYRYDTPDTSPEGLYGAGLMIGASALSQLPLALNHRSRIELVIGNVFTNNNKFEFYCGLAVKV